MESGWTLAETQPAGQNNQEIVTAEDISSQNQQTIQTTTQQSADPNCAMPARNPKAQWTQMIFLVLMFVILYMVMFRGPKKKQQQQQQMIQALKKNDRVQTIGGILGTVIDVGDNEITLKIDESNNTKMKVTPSSISRVIG